jgi:hypothetical protein
MQFQWALLFCPLGTWNIGEKTHDQTFKHIGTFFFKVSAL